MALGLLVLVITACDRQDNHWDAFDPTLRILHVAADTMNLAEGGPAQTFVISLGMVPADTVRVLVAADNDQIEADPDTVLFVPVDDDWARPRTVSVRAADDRIAEGPHTSAVTVLAVSRDADYDGQGGAGAVPVTIADNDLAGVDVSESSLTLVESAGGTVSETYRLRLLSQPVADVTVTASETTAEPSFHLDPTEVVFTPANWETEQEIRLWADLDQIDADNMNLVVEHAAASADPNYDAGLPVPSVAVALLDDTLPPTASLRLVVPGTTALVETGAAARLDVVVALDRASVNTVTVHLVTRDGIAVGGADFAAFDQDVVFLPGGALSQVFTVAALDDNLMETTEDFQVVISAVANVVVGEENRLDLTIVDDDQVTLSVAGVDGAEDAGSTAFVVSIPFAVPLPVEFVLTTSDGTATAGSDYLAINHSFVIAPGQTQRVIPVQVLADPASEPDETVNAVIGGLSGNIIWDGVPAVATILDDDPQSVVFADVAVAESLGHVDFTLQMVAPYTVDLVLTVGTLDGDGAGGAAGQEDALGGLDFTAVAAGAWTIPAGATSGSFRVNVAADGVAEAEQEFFRLQIQSASEAGFAGLTAACAIADANQPQIVLTDAGAHEFDPAAVFTASLRDQGGNPVVSQADVSFAYATVNQTAEGDVDFTAAAGTVLIPAGSGSADITINILDDTHDDDNETFVLDLSGPVNAALADDGSAPFCLITDDEFPSINLSQTIAAENEGSVHRFTVFLTTQRQDPTDFFVALAPGSTNGAGLDYTYTVAGLQTIPPFTSAVTFQVSFLDDQLAGEGNETLQALLSNADVALGVTVLDMTIIDAPALNIQPDAALEGVNLGFDVSLTAPSTADVTFRVQYSSGTANVLNDIDGSNTGPFTIPAGATTLTVQTPTIAGDGGDYAVEDFVITVINPANATLGAFNSATGQITDGDPPPLNLAGDASAVEGANVVFTVNLGWTSGAPVQFFVAYADGTAAGAGIDFDDSALGPFTVPAGALGTTVAVPTIAGDGPELAVEDFAIVLQNPTNGVLGDTTVAMGLIRDGNQPALTIPAGDSTVEGGTLSFTIHLDPPTPVPVFFDLAFTNGSTQGASDFTVPGPGPFSMMPGTTDTTITVLTVDDAVFESAEQFVVRIAAGPTNAVVGTPAQAIGVITDND